MKQCGRGPDRNDTKDIGVCPAATDISSNGINGGRNAGRICWDVLHTLCDGKAQNNSSQKAVSCVSCDVFNRVRAEEGIGNFSLLKMFRNSQSIDWVHDAAVECDIEVKLPGSPYKLRVDNSTGEFVKDKSRR